MGLWGNVVQRGGFSRECRIQECVGEGMLPARVMNVGDGSLVCLVGFWACGRIIKATKTFFSASQRQLL